MLQLAKLLHYKNFHITFVNTEYNHNRLLRSHGPAAVAGLPSFRFETIPDGLPQTDGDSTQEQHCLGPFKGLIARLNEAGDVPPVSCIVADVSMFFTLDAAKKFGVPEIMLWTASVCGLLGFAQYPKLLELGIIPFKGLASAVLGFAAEGKRIKASQVKEIQPGLCSYPRSPAYALGIVSAFALLVAQIFINVASGCICCRRNPYTSTTHWTLAIVCFIISWFTFVVAFLLLLGGAALNDQHGVDNEYFSYYYCYVVKPGVFAVAAVLSLASVTLGILYYLTISSGKEHSFGGPTAPNQSGIAMGQAQVPPTSHDPVFVHEDTYVRRQFT